MKRILLLAAAILAPFLWSSAHAQLSNAKVATDCASTTYPNGTTRQIVITTAGLICTSASATGTFTDAATGTTGNAVPAAASYTGINVAGNTRGWTGVNPSGSIFAGQIDLASVAGATVATGHGTAAGAIRVELPTDGTGILSLAPSTVSTVAITPVVSSALEASHVLKASAGNLYRVAVTSGALGGYLLVFNATTAPGDGAVTPILCRALPANASLEVDHAIIPDRYSTGITAVFSTTGCFTKTASATATFDAEVQ